MATVRLALSVLATAVSVSVAVCAPAPESLTAGLPAYCAES